MRSVQLFATCLGDLAFPEAVADAEALLRQAGFEVVFPARQVCCGQPAFNAGHRAAARRVARTRSCARSRATLPIVAPSGSCATMASHYLPELLGVEPLRGVGAVRVPRRGRASAAPRNDGRRSPTTTRATCCASCTISDAAAARCSEASGAEARAASRGPISAAGSAGRSRSASPRCRVAMADDKLGERPARRRGARDRRPGLPDAPARPARADRRAGSVVHLATALARGVDARELAQPRGAVPRRSRAASSATRTSSRRSTTSTDRLLTHRLRARVGGARRRRGAARAGARDPDARRSTISTGTSIGSTTALEAQRRPRLLRAHRRRGERLRRRTSAARGREARRRSRSRWRPRRSGSTRPSRRSA